MFKFRYFLQHFFYELKRKLLKTKFFAEFDIINFCQLNCKHCYFKSNKNVERKSDEEWIIFFKQLYKKGVRHVLLVGGEPTLKLDLIKEATKIFPFVDIITNGLIKVPENIKCRIFLSIDGTKQTHDKIRGEGTYNVAMLNYRNDTRVIINFTFTNENYAEFQDVIENAIANGIKSVVCNLVTPNIDVNSDNNIDPLINGVRNQIIQDLKFLKNKYPKILKISNQIIEWYSKPDHTQKCYWRENSYHFDSDFNPRRCFADLNCKFCGCYSGASLSTKNPFY